MAAMTSPSALAHGTSPTSLSPDVQTRHPLHHTPQIFSSNPPNLVTAWANLPVLEGISQAQNNDLLPQNPPNASPNIPHCRHQR